MHRYVGHAHKPDKFISIPTSLYNIVTSPNGSDYYHSLVHSMYDCNKCRTARNATDHSAADPGCRGGGGGGGAVVGVGRIHPGGGGGVQEGGAGGGIPSPPQLGGMGEHCKLPHQGLGLRPKSQRFLHRNPPPPPPHPPPKSMH